MTVIGCDVKPAELNQGGSRYTSTNASAARKSKVSPFIFQILLQALRLRTNQDYPLNIPSLQQNSSFPRHRGVLLTCLRKDLHSSIPCKDEMRM